MQTQTPRLPELTFKVFFVSLFLVIILVTANTYLALKIGMLTSASIPAAILSMAILRFFNGNILENNLVQTCASTGEAVAGGIVYTLPGLIMIHYWTRFPYWQTVLFSLLGGVVGVMFSVPLRKVLVFDKKLPFPEAKAIAIVLEASARRVIGLSAVIWGAVWGAVVEFLESGVHLIAESAQYWVIKRDSLWGGAIGFSPALLGAGYLIGMRVGVSLLIGALIGWVIGIPWLSSQAMILDMEPQQMVAQLWSTHLRYIGVGAMLFAGLWTLVTLLPSLVRNLMEAFQHRELDDHERDIPMTWVFFVLFVTTTITFFLFRLTFPFLALDPAILAGFAVLYFLVIGFVVCAICGYFSGLVGVSASPGSSAIISGMLLLALLLRFLVDVSSEELRLSAAAITIIVGGMITSAAAITNDNIQDLKVGQLVGATPWKQQLMLLLGVLVGSLLTPLVMQALFQVYGIGDVFPSSAVNHMNALAAPPAALMAAIAQAVFNHQLPWQDFLLGAGISVVLIGINAGIPAAKRLPILGIATGIYLPMTSTVPLFLGACLSLTATKNTEHAQRAMTGACGLVAGAAMMSILLTIPFLIMGDPQYLAIKGVSPSWAVCLGFVALIGLAGFLKSLNKETKS